MFNFSGAHFWNTFGWQRWNFIPGGTNGWHSEFQNYQIIALLWSMHQYTHHRVVIGYWFVILRKQYILLIHLSKHWIATISYTLHCCSSSSEKKLFNSSDYNQFRTQTQNCMDSFVFILLILFSHIGIRMYTTWTMMIYYDLLSIWCRTNQSI